MKQVILVDFGASRVKAALWDLDGRFEVARKEVPSPVAVRDHGRHEIDGEAYWSCWVQTAGQLIDQLGQPEVDVWLCSEMHGFLLVGETGLPVTGYISWQDQRGTETRAGQPSLWDSLESSWKESFFERTQMTLRPGLPILNLAHWFRHDRSAEGSVRLFSLCDWLIYRAGDPQPKTHPSMAAASGLFNIADWRWDVSLLEWASGDIKAVEVSPIADGFQVGSFNTPTSHVRVWGGVGDLQAALLGAGFPQDFQVAINLGTGSQVAVESETLNQTRGEARPTAAGTGVFRTVTHIPSGRAINLFASFIDELATLSKGESFFWTTWASLSKEEVLAAPPNADLSVFESAWHYSSNSGFLRFREGASSPRQVISSLAHSWLEQYRLVFEELRPPSVSTVVIAGGLARRGLFTAPVLETMLGIRCVTPRLSELDETLMGLRNLAESVWQPGEHV